MNPILVAIDGSDPSNRALRVAVELAQAASAPLHLVHGLLPPVVPMDITGYANSQLWSSQRQWAEQMVTEVRSGVPASIKITTSIEVGSPAQIVTAAAKETHAYLTVVGKTGAGATVRLLLGSTAHKIVHTSESPVLVTRPDSEPSMRSFFVAADESACAARAARFAAELASKVGGNVTLTYVSAVNLIPDIPAYHQIVREMEAEESERVQRLLNGLVAELSSFKVSVKTRRVTGGPETFIEDAEANGADCLVVGSRGRNALARVMLGSFADRVLNASKRNVLVVR